MLSNRNYYNCKLIKNRIDLYLYEMAQLFANLGTDSTLEDIQAAYKKENEMIDKIAELDAIHARAVDSFRVDSDLVTLCLIEVI